MELNETAQNQNAPAWEQLITEGHVLAGRLRRTSLSVVLTGLVLLLLGSFGLLYLQTSASRAPSGPSEFLSEKIRDYRQSAIDALQGLGFNRELTEKDRKDIAPVSQLPALIDSVLQSLNETGALPKNIVVAEISPKVFWNARWGNEHSIDTILSVTRKNVMALGALVNVGNENNPVVEQWIGIFRKQDDKWWGLLNWASDNNKGKWSYANLSAGTLYSVDTKPSVSPQEIPVSIHELTE